MFNRVISVLTALVLIIAPITTTAFADEDELEYARRVLDEVAEQIMAEHENVIDRFNAICNWVQSFEYGSGQSVYGYILDGTGDCWASADAALALTERMGYTTARAHSSEIVTWRGGHVYAVVKVDGIYYVVDPLMGIIRGYNVPFRHSRLEDGTTEITEYLGFDGVITVPEMLGGLTVTSIGETAFGIANGWMDEKITKITLPDTITNIGGGAFSGCNLLREINIPYGVTTIGGVAFFACFSLGELFIPATVSTIGMGAFEMGNLGPHISNPRLDIIVCEDNPYFYSDRENGVLFTADRRTIIRAYNLKSADYVIPHGVTHLADGAFADTRINNVVFPDTLEDIGFNAFRRCLLRNQAFYLPESVTGIGNNAFSMSQFSSITIMNPDCVIGNTLEYDLYLRENGSTLNPNRGISIPPNSDNHPILLFGLPGSTLETYANTHTHIDYRFFPVTSGVYRFLDHSYISDYYIYERQGAAVKRGFIRGVSPGTAAVAFRANINGEVTLLNKDGTKVSGNPIIVSGMVVQLIDQRGETFDFSILTDDGRYCYHCNFGRAGGTGWVESCAECNRCHACFPHNTTTPPISTTTTPPTTTTLPTMPPGGKMPPFTPAIAEGKPTIGDALEILKFLAGLPNSINTAGGQKPTIGDALEVLKKLAGLPSVFDNRGVSVIVTSSPPITTPPTATTTTPTTTPPPTTTTPLTTQPSQQSVTVGEIIQLGGSDWRVLDIQDGKALILSDKILTTRQYHSNRNIDVTWENSDIRAWLNGDFYSETFMAEEKSRIVEVTLLSAEEIEKYPVSLSSSWWWTRSVGSSSNRTALVRANGSIDSAGNHVDNNNGGIRPALWLIF
jgi:hypothetical protein